jgi:hypothetical protein
MVLDLSEVDVFPEFENLGRILSGGSYRIGWVAHEGGMAATAIDCKGDPAGMVYIRKNLQDQCGCSITAYRFDNGKWAVSSALLGTERSEAECTLVSLLAA